jgi:hypothetical protein
MLCDICGYWVRPPSDTLGEHHPNCPRQVKLSSCECGATVASSEPCLFCGTRPGEKEAKYDDRHGDAQG